MAEYIERRMTSNKLYDVYEYVKRNIIADGKPVDASLVKNIMLRFEKALNAVPNADVAPVRHARWEVVVGSDGKEHMVCTGCRKQQDLTGVFAYCPNCGAKMMEG